MVILTVTELNSSVRIVAAASDRENVEKLEHAGADRVTSPDFLGSRLLIESAVMGKYRRTRRRVRGSRALAGT
jgi:voltage-gated potassium channel